MAIKPSLLGIVATTLSGAATAMEAARPAYVPPPAAVSTGSMLQITFSLLLVLVAIAAVAWLLKRMNIAQQGTGNLLKVIGSVAIGQRERVVLLEVEDTWLLVGVGPNQIRTLHTLPKSAENQSVQQPVADNKFAQLLTSLRRTQDRNSDAP